MKIALVYDRIYPFLKGGGEKRFYDVGKGLAKKGHEVHLYGMKSWKGKDVIKKEGMYYHGICKPKKFYLSNGKRSIWEAIYFGLACFKLLKADFDILDSSHFPYFSLFPCKLACILKRKPLIVTWHEVWGKEYWLSYIGKKGYLGYLVERLAVLMPNKIISISEHTTKGLKNNLNSKKKIYTIPGGIDFKKIQKIKPAKENSDIIFAGRLLEYKNIDILIKAIKIIKDTKSKINIKCLIMGDGPEKANLEKLTKKLKLEKNIRFKGFIEKEEDVLSLIKSSKVFVLPSTREGFGIVVIEANACGIPVITVNHKDNAAKNLISNGKNGFVCKLDEKSIAKTILKTIKLQNPNNKMKQNCLNSVRKYGWDKTITKIEGVYGK